MDTSKEIESLCPCEYCKKKDRVVLEVRDEKLSHGIQRFYRIRCTRLLCRVRNELFYPYYDTSCSLEKIKNKWNARFIGCDDWRKLQKHDKG